MAGNIGIKDANESAWQREQLEGNFDATSAHELRLIGRGAVLFFFSLVVAGLLHREAQRTGMFTVKGR